MGTSTPQANSGHNNQPTTLVIVGASGDLTDRLLLPAVGQVLALEPQRQLTVIGNARHEPDDWAGTVRAAFESVSATGPAVEATIASTRYVVGDTTDAQELTELLGATEGRVILYYALPPAVTEKALETLAQVEQPDDLWIALEKPIGTDQESARRLNQAVAKIVPEQRIFRVDHFLGMPAVLDLVGLRLTDRKSVV